MLRRAARTHGSPARGSCASRSRCRSRAQIGVTPVLLVDVRFRAACQPRRQPARGTRGRGARRVRAGSRASSVAFVPPLGAVLAPFVEAARRLGERVAHVDRGRRRRARVRGPRCVLAGRAAVATVARRARRPRPTFPTACASVTRSIDVRHHTIVMGILNRTPDSFYDRGATWEFDAFLARADELVARRRRPARRRRREGRSRAGGRRGRGARSGRARDRGAPRALRRADLGRHVAGVGARCRVRSGRGRRQRHLRVRRSRLPAGRRQARRDRRRHAHPPATARPRPRTPLRRPRRRRHRVPPRARAGARRQSGCGPSRSSSTPASTSASRRRRARCSCARAQCTPRSATRCCSRRRTSGSSVSCSTGRSTTGVPSRSPRSRTACSTGAGSCACTTCSDPRGCAGCSKPCSRQPIQYRAIRRRGSDA